MVQICFFFQAEDGIRDLVRSRGLGDVYKRQYLGWKRVQATSDSLNLSAQQRKQTDDWVSRLDQTCLLYTSDAADERSSVDLGGRRIIKKKKRQTTYVEDAETQMHHKNITIQLHTRPLSHNH